MLGKLLAKIVGDPNEKILKDLQPIVDEINDLEPEFAELRDDDLSATTYELRSKLQNGEFIDDILPEAFAAVREASKRVLGMRHFDVQLIGGIVLHEGKIAEMRTGEGKTLVATLAAYLNAIDGKQVHVVTVNDYLAKRDASWMGAVYTFMGLSVGCLQQNGVSYIFDENYRGGELEDGEVEDASAKFAAVAGEHLKPASKREAYQCDVLYGTNNEFGFDYLRDNMVFKADERVQSGLSYAIVDEVDNILIDEARTPLLISGPGVDAGRDYTPFARVAKRLSGSEDFELDLKRKNVSLTEKGSEKVEKILGIKTLYSETGENHELPHLVENAVRAEHMYAKDREYVVRDGEIVIVDEFTGRLMEGRRFSDGMHQALEAKEGVRVQAESSTYATITLQNYFRMYDKLAGMTGTAVTEAEEFSKIYTLDVVEIPTNRSDNRIDGQDLIYMTEKAKWTAAADEIEKQSLSGRPVLVGTTTIEKSQVISSLLRQRRIEHRVLNAKEHESESQVIAQAGLPGAVTVATNMAGRGTDIILGGNPDVVASKVAKDDGDPMEIWQKQHDGVVDLGGLFVLGTERHESRRIDNQLRGRTARQGDPGETRFYLSVEDDLVRRFGGDRIKGALETFSWEEDVPIENSMLVKSIENAQQKVEGINFEIRKHLVEYDDVANTQRDVVYKMRDRIVNGEDFRPEIKGYIKDAMSNAVSDYLGGDSIEWDTLGFQRELRRYFPIVSVFRSDVDFAGKSQSDIERELHDFVDAVYSRREVEFGEENLRMVEQSIMIRTLDRHWVRHLTQMENMRQSIGLQAVGQRDPLVQYRTMSFGLFEQMNEEIRSEVARIILQVAPNIGMIDLSGARAGVSASKLDAANAARRIAMAQAQQQSVMSAARQLSTASTGNGSSTGSNGPVLGPDGRPLSRKQRRMLERRDKKRSKAVR